jgi:hypothetical protein
VDHRRDGNRLDRGYDLGGLAVAYSPVVFLKVLLGCVLLAAAGKTLTH